MKLLTSRIHLMWTAAVALACVTLLSACSKDDDEQKTPQTRTVLVYMSAENTLSSYAEADLKEIMDASIQLTEDDQLLVWYDRAKKDELPWLARMVNGKLKDSVSIADMQISNKDDYSSDPHVFEKVLTYAYSHYPAVEGYGLVLWSHASGWLKADSIAYSRAYGVDNGINSSYSNNGPFLNIPTIRRILEGQPHLDFILADCCNFMCLESIYELRSVTDYIVGSPAEIPDPGAPYATVVPEMFKRQNAAKGIMLKYAECYQDALPLSVAKTSEMEALAEATHDVLKAIYSRLGMEYPDMTGMIHYYNESPGRFYPYYNIFYDAGDFVKQYATDAEYKQWKTALDRVVIDKAFAKSWMVNKSWYTHYSDFEMTEERYHGVSMFVPQDPGFGYYKRYNNDIKMMAWWWKVWE
ncbi:MAG: hypothetical protein IJ886_02370 [Prevotella sp.]|nr:hypothetical protein [Prevotella sp.]